jgi:hypothetical protein
MTLTDAQSPYLVGLGQSAETIGFSVGLDD